MNVVLATCATEANAIVKVQEMRIQKRSEIILVSEATSKRALNDIQNDIEVNRKIDSWIGALSRADVNSDMSRKMDYK